MKADIVLRGNAVFTSCADAPEKKLITVKGNRIIAVDEFDSIDSYVDENTRVIECGDRLVTPGFNDNHFHLAHGINQVNCVDLSLATSEEDAVQKVIDFAEKNPGNEPIFGYYWYHMNWKEKKLPTKHSLDKYFPDRPVILYRVESHGAWLNSKALELLQINENTPNPIKNNGEIVKGEDGKPTGYIHELAIFVMGRHSIKSREKDKSEYVEFFKKLSRYGVTSISDLQYDMPTRYDIFTELEEEGNLNIRYGFATILSDDLTKAREHREKYNSEKIKYLGLKQYVDGTILGYTGELLEPYEDKPETRNEMPFDFDEITQNALAADREGFRVRLHTIGDGAVRIALDAFQRCREENGIRDSRHSIAHIEVVNDADIPRLNELGVIYDAHPAHVNLPCEKAEDNPYPVHLGKRADNCFMYKTILDTGAHLAVGSDFPVVEPDPMLGIYRGVTRKFNDGLPEEGWIPSERLSMAEILKAYTIGTAYHDFKDDITGTLEAGKCADIVILDRNLFDLETPEEILETKPVMTIFDGRIVYEA